MKKALMIMILLVSCTQNIETGGVKKDNLPKYGRINIIGEIGINIYQLDCHRMG
jgi:hypothetical protein